MSHNQPTDREAIRDVLATYCRGVDRRDREAVRGCFHSDATDDHGTGARSIPEFIEWCFALLDGYDSTFHFLGQSHFDFRADDQAVVETYGIASHRSASGPAQRNLVSGFRYVDTMTDRGGWRIAQRVAISDWSRVDRENDWWEISVNLLSGRPGPDDPSYAQ